MRHPAARTTTGPDRWSPFAALTGIEVVRSAAFFGILLRKPA